ncbi:lysine N(6)-hydroxylase/L-ornithine N(5)-oxygenase family protein [Microbulbifer sp. 2205BS26-8]|uniref:lysine N(6)-hydroxylase/L-ornithine N(5)-oxygenase family protein n=1 Tax=Microbulbifer sp. 2205BS26-8 TaxID=3064386 RepID=UPI00273D233A|nr:SidA/IucD/PvdA family monooxygenase [Microbulbifer sp. 2205BS26-8]MDP5210180.1 SidA/IucD/PvdA family monooxygenase [Microbulbifer sp. 2205BS26-8]
MSDVLDLAGIGAGPFNLAVAALIREKSLAHRFFEAKVEFSWHPGLMLPGVMMQTSFLKDLVTPVDPTNPCSFLAYLVEKKRFYDFLHAEQRTVSRREFADYLSWAARRLDSVQMSSRVQSVLDRGAFFELDVHGPHGRERVRARNLCVAAGKTPNIPQCCRPLLSDNCFHALEIALRNPDVSDKRVAVVGGGQTGAEVVINLLGGHWGCPRQVVWASRRSNYLPLDETPFTNDWFTPEYVDVFRQLSPRRREEIIADQKLASDGISPATLTELYRLFYRLAHIEGDLGRVALLPNRALVGLSCRGDYQLQLENNLLGEADGSEWLNADIVILCTGLREALPPCLAPLQERIPRDEARHILLDDAFAAKLIGDSSERRLYFLGTGRTSHGIAEPQLSLSAWRGALVVNDLLGSEVYDLRQSGNFMKWVTHRATQVAVA